MIYLDNAATSFPKPAEVAAAIRRALATCANPGRGGYPAAMAALETLYRCRETAGRLFHCEPDRVVLTSNCTQGLNMAIRTLVKPGETVVISGFEHNAVVRPLHALGARVEVAGRKLFDWEDTLTAWEAALRRKPRAAVFTHVSNVFGYELPVEALAGLCRRYGVPFILDAAQSAGTLPLDFEALGAAFVAMPGHKGLLGPQGTGLLLCGQLPEPLLLGGTGGSSLRKEMPEFLPDRGEAGTQNVPGAAGLTAGMLAVEKLGMETLRRREQQLAQQCAGGLQRLGFRVFTGAHQSGVVSFLPPMDCEEAAAFFARHGIALRGGLHCAPLAHESAHTLDTGTLRLSTGPGTREQHIRTFLQTAARLPRAPKEQ